MQDDPSRGDASCHQSRIPRRPVTITIGLLIPNNVIANFVRLSRFGSSSFLLVVIVIVIVIVVIFVTVLGIVGWWEVVGCGLFM